MKDKTKLEKEYNDIIKYLRNFNTGIDLFYGRLLSLDDLESQLKTHSKFLKHNKRVNLIKNAIKLIEIGHELGYDIKKITDDRLMSFCEQQKLKKVYKQKPQKEGRDNKGVYVGTGGSNAKKIRYPSKKRSRRTWKIFYEMFPQLAKEDNWNGKTSNKMK